MKYVNYINALSENIRHKSLNTIERDIVSLLCEGKTYIEIAEKLSYDDGYVGSVSRELYGLIGQKHKVKVTRSNLISTLDSVMGGEIDNTFNVCHNIKEAVVFNRDILRFNQNEILINVSTFWKFDVKNNALILKTQYPLVLNLSELENNSFKTILHLARQEQLSGDALLELFKILNSYYSETNIQHQQLS